MVITKLGFRCFGK